MKAKDLTLFSIVLAWGFIIELILGRIIETWDIIFLGLLFWRILKPRLRICLVAWAAWELAAALLFKSFTMPRLVLISWYAAVLTGFTVTGVNAYLALRFTGYYSRLEDLKAYFT